MALTPNLGFRDLIKTKNILNFIQWKIFIKRSIFRAKDLYKIPNALQRLKPIHKRIYRYLDDSSKKILIAPTFAQKETLRTILYEQKSFFKGVTETVCNLDCQYIIDIGANIGYYSRAYASNGSNLEIIAIEPDLRNLSFAAHNLSDLGNVFIFHMGLSNKYGRFTVSLPEISKSRIGEKKYLTGSLSALGGEDKKGTRFVRGDDLLEFLNIDIMKIGWIKIDVEGFEMNVLNGFPKIIRETNAIIELEINPQSCKATNTSIKDFLHKMEEYSYEPYIYYLYNLQHMREARQFDIFFIKNNSEEHISQKLNLKKMNSLFIDTWEYNFKELF